MAGARGFALLVVLWALVPLSLLFLVLAAAARSDVRSASALRAAATLEAAADGAIATMLFEQLAAPGQPAASRRMRLAGVTVEADLAAVSGVLNPNTAPPELLGALLAQLGAGDAAARRIAGAIVDWRTPGQRTSSNGAKAAEYRAAGLPYGPPGAPFESLDELGLVLGLTPRLLDALLPYMSPYAAADPDLRRAGPALRQALLDIGARPGSSAAPPTIVQITARAVGSEARVTRRATVALGPPAGGRIWRALAWETVPEN